MMEQIKQKIDEILEGADSLAFDQKIEVLNHIRLKIKEFSPFKTEPIDCIQWVPVESVTANDYNPNSVAPPEMELLRLSIESDGYTQPVVVYPSDNGFTVVDGFHRTRVCKELESVNNRVHGYLPVTIINEDREDRNDLIASTIRHNRARGKHAIDSMSEIVIELKRRNWSDKKIGKELGMDEDEVLRLTQISGLLEMFSDSEFSQAWEAEMFTETEEDIAG